MESNRPCNAATFAVFTACACAGPKWTCKKSCSTRITLCTSTRPCPTTGARWRCPTKPAFWPWAARCTSSRRRCNTTPRRVWTISWMWACAARGWATRRACSRPASSAQTGCWCRASWSMYLPTRPRRPPNRCRRPCARFSRTSRPAPRWCNCAAATGMRWATMRLFFPTPPSCLRNAVFVREQGIAADLEVDALDASAQHVVAYNRLGQAVATGRLLPGVPAPDGIGRRGRLAVDRSVRSAQWGRQLLDALLEAARARGDRQVQLHAQCSAEGFYRRAGFAAEGAPWEEAGIDHILMTRRL